MTFFEKNKKLLTFLVILGGILFFSDKVFAADPVITVTPKGNNKTLYSYTTVCNTTRTLRGKVGVIVPNNVSTFGTYSTYVYFHGADKPTVTDMCDGSNYNLCNESKIGFGFSFPIIIPETKNDGTWAQGFSSEDINCFLTEAKTNLLTKGITIGSNYVVAGHSGGANFVKRFFEAGFTAQKTLIFDGCYKPLNTSNEPWCQAIAKKTSSDLFIYYTKAETKLESLVDYNGAANKSRIHLFELNPAIGNLPAIAHEAVPNLCFQDHIKHDSCQGKATAITEDAPLAVPACKIDGKCWKIKIGDPDPTGLTGDPIDPTWMETYCTAPSKVFLDSQTCTDDTAATTTQPPATGSAGANTNSANLDTLRGYANQLNKTQAKSLPELIGVIIKGLMGVIGSIALVMIIYGGVLWMTARGNSEQMSTAKNTIVWAALGIVLIFASYALVNFVFEIFK